MKILLPVDGSPHALAAVQTALRWVREGLKAEFVLVNVQSPASLYEMVVAHDVEVIGHVRGAAGADLLRPAEQLLEAAGLPYESEVAGGAAEHLIAELAENYGCDAIVMGARGSSAAGDTRGLGSVVQAVLAESTLPVTVVRLDGEPDTAADDDTAAPG